MRAIVVGVDSTNAAERALDRALVEGQRTGRDVRLVHAWQPPVWVGGALGYSYDYDVLASGIGSDQDARNLTEDLLAKARTRIGGDLPQVTVDVIDGSAGHVLVEASEDAALLIVGGRGHGPMASALLGSATAHALHHASCPVMVVPEHGVPAAPYHRVVVGIDGSDASRSALRWGYQVAQKHGCPLVGVHAWLLATMPSDPHDYFGADLVSFEDASGKWAAHEVQDVLGEGAATGDSVHGSASHVLLDYASVDDLLVLGSRGQGGFAGLHLGSVSEQCTRHSHGTVAVLRAGQERLDD